MNWTPKLTKALLPNVHIRFPDRHIATAKVSGRKMKFATLSTNIHGTWLNAGECTWETIANSLNKGTPISI